MGKKRKLVYSALLDGATAGHTDAALHDFVQKRCPKTSSKRLVRAALLALTDAQVKDRNVLDTIYALAIKVRVKEIASDGDQADQRGAETSKVLPLAKAKKNK